jgi:hypothetical protein
VGGRVRRVSVVEAGRQGLVEAEVGLGITIREVEDGGLVEQEVTLWRAARGGEGWGAVWEVEMEEDGGDDGRVGEKGEDGHLAAARRAEQGQDFVDACEQHGPSDPRGAGALGGFGSGRYA